MTAADLTLSDAAALGRLRVEVAQACRVPAAEGLVSDILGHVSVRVGPDHMLIRSRSPLDPGLLLSRPEDVVLTDLDGNPVEELGDRALPQELPTHAEVLRARPDDGAVVHAHPPDVVLCSVAGLELLPIDGAFGIPAMRLAERGIPVFDYYGLVKSRARAEELVQAMSKARGSGAAWPRAHHGGVHDRRPRSPVPSSPRCRSIASRIRRRRWLPPVASPRWFPRLTELSCPTLVLGSTMDSPGSTTWPT